MCIFLIQALVLNLPYFSIKGRYPKTKKSFLALHFLHHIERMYFVAICLDVDHTGQGHQLGGIRQAPFKDQHGLGQT